MLYILLNQKYTILKVIQKIDHFVRKLSILALIGNIFLFVVVIVVSIVLAALGFVVYYSISSNPEMLKAVSDIKIFNDDRLNPPLNFTSMDMVSFP